jgi:hypothetical protein
MTAPGRCWESGQDWDAQDRPGIPGSFQVLQKELHCDPIRATDEGEVMIINNTVRLAIAAACLATIATVPQAPAQTAPRTVVVKHPPVVS